jgi:hypothetical protein
MARYTIEMGELISNNFDIGLKDYPIFDENYRDALNTKIKDHFRFREIGFETPALFKFYLNRTMKEIMPLYNQYYKSALLEFNPLVNNDMTSSGSRESNTTMTGSGSNKSSSTNTGYNMHSDTPQGNISQLDIDNNKHLTTADKDTATGSTNTDTASESQGDSTDNYINTVLGISGITGSELLLKFRDTFINVDMMIINELNSLFMNLW